MPSPLRMNSWKSEDARGSGAGAGRCVDACSGFEDFVQSLRNILSEARLVDSVRWFWFIEALT